MNDDLQYRLFRLLEANPSATQRELSRELGISLGKANYCLRALIDKGWVKVSNFRRSQNKGAYLYLLTPHGIEAKARLTTRFLKRKIREYQQLEQEIEQLRKEVAQTEPGS